MNKVYVVYCEQGEYSDYRMNLVDACSSEEEAKELIKLITDEWEIIKRRHPFNTWSVENIYDKYGSPNANYDFIEMEINAYKKVFKGESL
jgi:hypothetical protein